MDAASVMTRAGRWRAKAFVAGTKFHLLLSAPDITLESFCCG
jgi:hypothetical protein